MTPPLDLRPLNPFVRLNSLLDGLTPGHSPKPDGAPLNLGIGDPRTGVPGFGLEAMQERAAGWSSYPPFQGHPRLLAAAADWLTRLYDLPAGFLTEKGRVLPCSGTREGLFFLTMAAATSKRHQLGAARPLALLPDPGYHVYAGAALAVDIEPRYVRVDAAGGHLPDFSTLPEADLNRAAIAFFCSPANPQGAAASREQVVQTIALARQHGILLMVDECYADLYFGEAPVGALSIAAEQNDLNGLVTAHSLSKRSGAPGLRCGFLTGDTQVLNQVEGLLRFGGAGVPLPVQEAAIALLADESHVEANRAFYSRNMDLAARHFRQPFGWSIPAGGFMAWLDVSNTRHGNGEAAARALWLEAGIRTLPGAYMSLSGHEGAENPGHPYLRIALVDEADLLDRALARIVEVLL